MSDIKLDRVQGELAEELRGESAALEQSLQAQIEQDLPTLFGVRMLASEYSTGKKHGGRINCNVELIRCKCYGFELLLLKLVNGANVHSNNDAVDPEPIPPEPAENYNRPLEYLERADQAQRDLYAELLAFACALGDDVQVEPLKLYVAFRRIKNFICVEPHPAKGTLTLFLKLGTSSVELEPRFTRDVSAIVHYGTGDLEVTLRNWDDLSRAQTLVAKSYEAS